MNEQEERSPSVSSARSVAEEIADYAGNISATRAGLVKRIQAALDDAARLPQEQAHQPLMALIAKWRGADADDAVSRGYVETGHTFQVCANELEAVLKDPGGTR